MSKKTPDRDGLIRQAYSLATAELRKAHQAEFSELQAKHAAALGVEWKPRPTAEDKAREQVAALVEKFGADILPAEEVG